MKKSIGAKSIIYPTPVLIVCTYDGTGKPNAMTASWGGICCSRPPCIAISLRKATYTYQNIVERKAFTINIPSESQINIANYFGTTSGKNEDKFATSKMTDVRSKLVDAPYLDSFPFILECQMIHSIEIGGHTQFIGEILDIKIEESMLEADGKISIEKLKPVIYAPELRAYYKIGDYISNVSEIQQLLTEKSSENN